MQKLLFIVALALSFTVSADDVGTYNAAVEKLTAQCQGLDTGGYEQCLKIIYRYAYGNPANPPPMTLAEKTGIDAVMESDRLAVIVLLPDGSRVLGHVLPGDTLANRYHAATACFDCKPQHVA
jgi:hypothetical protein